MTGVDLQSISGSSEELESKLDLCEREKQEVEDDNLEGDHPW